MNDKILYKDSVSLLSFESLYCIGGYVTFEILVSTSGFAGNCNFCIGEKTIQDYTNCLDTMISLLDGEVIVRAAGGALLCAELLKAQGYITKK